MNTWLKMKGYCKYVKWRLTKLERRLPPIAKETGLFLQLKLPRITQQRQYCAWWKRGSVCILNQIKLFVLLTWDQLKLGFNNENRMSLWTDNEFTIDISFNLKRNIILQILSTQQHIIQIRTLSTQQQMGTWWQHWGS